MNAHKITRPEPYGEDRIRQMATELVLEFGGTIEHHMANLRKIDRAYCNNARVPDALERQNRMVALFERGTAS